MAQKKPAGKSPINTEERFPMVATTLQGLEEVLADELRKIGGNEIVLGKRAVTFTADKDLVYKANLRLRTALRILKPLNKFRASNEDEFYKKVKAIDWPSFFDVDKTFLIRSTVTGEVFTNSHYITLKCKDAVVDHFNEKLGSRPSIDSRFPDVVIHLKINRNDVNISLDSSGTPLNKRGYRQAEAAAPVNECLAAGMLLLSGYQGKTTLVDGMCGSGTLCIEAALMANQIAPGLLRDEFSFMHWKDYDADLYEIIHQATVNRIKDAPVRIIGFEKKFAVVQQARDAAQIAGVEEMVEFRMTSFFEEQPPAPPAHLVMNPPYGERLKERDIEQFYTRIGDKLKADYAGYQAWILSANNDAMKRIGLRTFNTFHLMNGKLPVRFSGYRMYTGSKNQ
ncbi:MAG: class I SAM-dependent RNA methyltransferase [Cryomorphaceae bacterium]